MTGFYKFVRPAIQWQLSKVSALSFSTEPHEHGLDCRKSAASIDLPVFVLYFLLDVLQRILGNVSL